MSYNPSKCQDACWPIESAPAMCQFQVRFCLVRIAEPRHVPDPEWRLPCCEAVAVVACCSCLAQSDIPEGRLHHRVILDLRSSRTRKEGLTWEVVQALPEVRSRSQICERCRVQDSEVEPLGGCWGFGLGGSGSVSVCPRVCCVCLFVFWCSAQGPLDNSTRHDISVPLQHLGVAL